MQPLIIMNIINYVFRRYRLFGIVSSIFNLYVYIYTYNTYMEILGIFDTIANKM